jgi:hypothetical protein
MGFGGVQKETNHRSSANHVMKLLAGFYGAASASTLSNRLYLMRSYFTSITEAIATVLSTCERSAVDGRRNNIIITRLNCKSNAQQL